MNGRRDMDLDDLLDDPEALIAHLHAVDNAGLTSVYLRVRREFRDLLKRTERISRGSGGIPSTGNRMFWGSVLFTRIHVTAGSLDRLLPDPRPGQHWDFSAAASIARNLLEMCLLHHWLCARNVSDVEREARFLLMHLHDFGSRRRLMPEAFGDDHPAYVDLLARFDANAVLTALDAPRRRAALRGERTPFIQDDVLDSMGVDRAEFRLVYRLFSQHTHTGPMAFYDMLESERGAGVETRKEKAYLLLAMSYAHRFIEAAVRTHLTIFPDAETRAPHLTRSQIEANVEREQGRRPGRGRRG